MRNWWSMFEEIRPSWVRYAFVATVAVIATVFIGAVDTHGDAIKISLTLVGIVAASTASFITGRLINEHADRRVIRRKLSLARLRIVGLRMALTELLAGLKDVRTGDFRREDIRNSELIRVGHLADRAAAFAAAPPDFEDLIESDADLRMARSAEMAFGDMATFLPAGRVTEESLQTNRETYLAMLVEPIWIMSPIETLEEAERHITAKLEAPTRSVPSPAQTGEKSPQAM
jgi:hypothetical protein